MKCTYNNIKDITNDFNVSFRLEIIQSLSHSHLWEVLMDSLNCHRIGNILFFFFRNILFLEHHTEIKR